MDSRSQIEFKTLPPFDNAFDALERHNSITYARVLDKVEKFESEYRASRWDGDISSGFDFKQLGIEAGRYRVCQIEVTIGYRAAILLPQRSTKAYWLDFWKKTKMNNRKEVRSALKRAESEWEQL